MKPGTTGARAQCLALILMLAWATPASANGAMSLALATFNWGSWLLYILAIVSFEAGAMGRWLRLPLRRAVAVSIGANLITGILGGLFSGIVAYPFLGMFGSRLNPDPVGQTLLLFAGYGVVSAVVEAPFWMRSGVGGERSAGMLIVRRCLIVHLMGVPLGLSILLIPDRPFHGLEMQVAAERQIWLQNEVRGALTEYVAEHHALPPDVTYADVLVRLRPYLKRHAKDPGLWSAGFIPHYQRFDRTEMRREPVEWNVNAARELGLHDPPRTVWLTRMSYEGHLQGLILETATGSVRRTSDPSQLGWVNRQPATSTPRTL